MKQILFLALAALLVLGAVSFNTVNASDKVAICHIDSGADQAGRVIEVAPSAVAAHVENHGDYIVDTEVYPVGGACPVIE